MRQLQLVIRLNVEAEAMLRVESLRFTALAREGRAISAEAELETGPPARRALTRHQATWRMAVSDWQADLDVSEAARVLLEHRFLDGRDALLPDLWRQWYALLETTRRLAGPVGPIAGQRTRRSRAAGPRTAFSRGSALGRCAEADAASTADAARAAALDLLGDTDRAMGLAGCRLLARER